MQKKIFYIICIAVLIIGFAMTSLTEGMSNGKFSIITSVVSSGGTSMNSESYQMTATIGQSSPIGISSSSNYINYPGFWPTTTLKIKRKAMPWIPLLLLDE